MSTPVTRGELREEIQRLDLRLDDLDQKLEQRLAQMATKADLAQLASQMATKADLAQLASQMATKADLNTWGGALFERLLTELARHTKAIQEALSTQISTFDDKYADLPARVRHLEAAVFVPEQR
jgi:chromosome segregation ATPase